MKRLQFLLLLALGTMSAWHAAMSQQTPAFNWSSVSEATEWNAIFDRDFGWTGADGIYSFSSTGYDQRNSINDTYFIFGDTYIGTVIDNVRQPAGTQLVRNSMAILKGRSPRKHRANFYWGENGSRTNGSIFVPRTSNNESNDWFWPNDGVVIGNKLYIYAIQLNRTGTGSFGFEVNDVSLLEVTLNQGRPFRNEKQYDTPFFSAANFLRGNQYLGHAVMANTTQAGAPFPDGFVYVYGPRNDPLNTSMIAARVLPRHITNFSAYTFWNGSQWVDDFEQSAPVTDRISSEFSMTPLENGKFLSVFQRDGIFSAYVGIRVCDTPVGPCSEYQDIYACPEDAQGYQCYNAKAHPNLSKPGKLLISYNVNVRVFQSGNTVPNQDNNMTNADIYRPRFIWLHYDLGM